MNAKDYTRLCELMTLEISLNIDTRPKSIGDKVKLRNFSGIVDLETIKSVTNSHPKAKEIFIIIEEKKVKIIDCGAEYTCDCVISSLNNTTHFLARKEILQLEDFVMPVSVADKIEKEFVKLDKIERVPDFLRDRYFKELKI